MLLLLLLAAAEKGGGVQLLLLLLLEVLPLLLLVLLLLARAQIASCEPPLPWLVVQLSLLLAVLQNDLMKGSLVCHQDNNSRS